MSATSGTRAETTGTSTSARRIGWIRVLLCLQAFALIVCAASVPGKTLPVVIVVLLSGAASLVCCVAYPWRRDRVRRSALWLTTLAMPLYAVLIGVGASGPGTLAGIALAGVLITLLQPRFGLLRPRTRKVWLVLHVGFSVGWLGAAMAMLVLAVVGTTTSDAAQRHYAYDLMHIFDLALVIPLVLLSILTGLVVSLGTKWGLARHWWVLTKFVIALSIPVFAAIQESGWVRTAVDRTALDRDTDLQGTDVKLWVCFVVFTLLLWMTTTLSTIKPWGRTSWVRPTTQRAVRTRRS